MKLGIMCRICSALPIACRRHDAGLVKLNTIGCRSGWSCRQIFWPAFGLVMPIALSMSWKLATLKKQCARPAQLAMTDSNTGHAVTLCPIHLHTARPGNAYAGFAAVTRLATLARAIHSTRVTCNAE